MEALNLVRMSLPKIGVGHWGMIIKECVKVVSNRLQNSGPVCFGVEGVL